VGKGVEKKLLIRSKKFRLELRQSRTKKRKIRRKKGIIKRVSYTKGKKVYTVKKNKKRGKFVEFWGGVFSCHNTGLGGKKGRKEKGKS